MAENGQLSQQYIANYKDIVQAYDRIKQHIVRTPVLSNSLIDQLAQSNLYFKCENLQKGGAFKLRGGLNNVLSSSKEELQRGVVTHSSGNHGIAVSLAGKQVGVPTTIVLPKNTPQVKIDVIMSNGANIVYCENDYHSRVVTSDRLIKENGYKMVHPYNQKETMCGQGTIALELLEQVPNLDAIIVPISGGGLISGISIAAKAIKKDIKIFAAEPCGKNNHPDAYLSKQKGEIIKGVGTDTIADGLKAFLGENPYPIVRDLVDEIIVVTEQEIIDAMKLMFKNLKIVTEASGAASLAAALTQPFQDAIKTYNLQNVGIVVSGGNIDLDKYFKWDEIE